MQLIFTVLALCVCMRFMDCGVQGQVSECGSGAQRCYDLDLRMHLEPQRFGPRDSWERDDFESRRWVDDRWRH